MEATCQPLTLVSAINHSRAGHYEYITYTIHNGPVWEKERAQCELKC